MSGAVVLGLWSIVLEPGKTYSQNVSPGIQITNVALAAFEGNARTVVTVKYPEFEQDSDDEDDDEDEEESEDDEEGDIKLPKLITKEAVIAILKPNGTEQVSVNITLVEDVEVVEFSITGNNPVHLVGHYVRQEDFDQDPYSDSEADYDSDDESIDSDLEESMMEGLSGMIDGDEDDDEEERLVELKEEPKKANLKKREAEDEEVAALLADESMSSTLSKNQKKKLAKKQKVEAPVVEEKKENKVVAPAAKKAAAVQTLAGGLTIVDSKKGDGPPAKSGSKVGMRYIGKLENGKIFDSNTKGAPLNFTLGRGEVIKGWDVGVAGMSVGGERKLVIPAAMAYGKKGTSGIPGNSVLHFDVKLVSMK